MLKILIHKWERGLAERMTNRVIRPFEWGLDSLGDSPAVDASFSSAKEENNTVYARYFPVPIGRNKNGFKQDEAARARRRACVVLPQWNADDESHVALCRWLNRVGIAALRLSLPLLFDECDRNGVNFDRSVVPWGHYTMGEAPFKYYDGYLIVNYLRKHL